ncbi:MAG: hypothetical protein RBR69_07100 [Candidatus Cloacimonadaceae bacterium]|nr:hypothetical protein [Candidatus Cloacimonadota bacterium]MDD3533389.1 hypothetical protein [Candidatus Cloacimonadota bacterium]MDY0127879.1 hypothetical protein [Candidatus Cloacimonadaceae bacterium]
MSTKMASCSTVGGAPFQSRPAALLDARRIQSSSRLEFNALM